jgi:hypothetical protein
MKTVTSSMCISAYNIRTNIHPYKYHDNHSLHSSDAFPTPAAHLRLRPFPSCAFARFPLTIRVVQAPFRVTLKDDITFKVQVKSQVDEVVGRSNTELFRVRPAPPI